MKKLVLGLSALLMVVQSGFATEKEDMALAEQYKSHTALYQVLKCENEMQYHADKNGDPNICLKAVEYIKKGKDMGFLANKNKEYIAESYLNAGVIYYNKGDKLSAYKYFMKSAKLNNLQAQKNLDILCKQSSWACKQ